MFLFQSRNCPPRLSFHSIHTLRQPRVLMAESREVQWERQRSWLGGLGQDWEGEERTRQSCFCKSNIMETKILQRRLLTSELSEASLVRGKLPFALIFYLQFSPFQRHHYPRNFHLPRSFSTPSLRPSLSPHQLLQRLVSSLNCNMTLPRQQIRHSSGGNYWTIDWNEAELLRSPQENEASMCCITFLLERAQRKRRI